MSAIPNDSSNVCGPVMVLAAPIGFLAKSQSETNGTMNSKTDNQKM